MSINRHIFAPVINDEPINGYKNGCHEARRDSVFNAYQSSANIESFILISNGL